MNWSSAFVRVLSLENSSCLTNHNHQKVKVNALLDDGSSGTYLNRNNAGELDLKGRPHKLTVNVLNDNQEKLAASVVEFMISSSDGKVSKLASAYTAEGVTGSMQVVDWSKHKHKWKPMKGINFPHVGPGPIVDLLFGVDHADVLYSLNDVTGKAGEPIARLTSLGWTCIGNPEIPMEKVQTNFIFFRMTCMD